MSYHPIMNKTIRFLKIFFLSSFFLMVSCVEDDFDLSNIDTSQIQLVHGQGDNSGRVAHAGGWNGVETLPRRAQPGARPRGHSAVLR